ncbi:MAG: SufD family Fe-S cluster assembly protein [Thermofilum sp.]
MSSERVRAALTKPAPFGVDVDLSKFGVGRTAIVSGEPDRLLAESARQRVGVELEKASYVQVGETVFARAMAAKLAKLGVVVKPLRRALEEDELPRKLAWSIIDPATDKYTAYAYSYGEELGYYVYVPPGVKVPWPIYTCLSLFTGEEVQFAHNIVYVDEGGEAVVTTGCLVPHGVKGGVHIGISEFFVARGAKLAFAMIHAWGEGVYVRPRTAVRVEEGGEYLSYYAVYSPVASLQTYPTVHLAEGARAKLVSVIAGIGSGEYDIGGRAVLEGPGASAELVSRVLAKGGAKVYSRAEVKATAPRAKGHIECLGVLMDSVSSIEAIPILSSTVQEVELSHEAAIGMIAGEKVEYLMSKGFTEEEARAILLRGFLSAEESALPDAVRPEISRIIDYIVKHATG